MAEFPEKSLNKELIELVSTSAGISKAEASLAVDAIIDGITNALQSGVSLVGFVTFSVKSRAARTGRNPQTVATIKIKVLPRLQGSKPAKPLKMRSTRKLSLVHETLIQKV